MRISQSGLKVWSDCNLRWRFEQIDQAPREVSSAMSFGTAIHDAVMNMEIAGDLNVGLDRFRQVWSDLSILGIEYDYILPRNSHKGYAELGEKILNEWWRLIQWESDIVIAREYKFAVPIGDHTLSGIVDKLALRQIKGGEMVVLLSDYKTGSKLPTREYLAHDVQFTAYAYATTLPEFWAGIPDGDVLYRNHTNSRRLGEWVHLRGPKRVDAGFRYPYHYERLRYAVEAMDAAIGMEIFQPTLTGEACEFCPYRKVCGLPTREEEGLID